VTSEVPRGRSVEQPLKSGMINQEDGCRQKGKCGYSSALPWGKSSAPLPSKRGTPVRAVILKKDQSGTKTGGSKMLKAGRIAKRKKEDSSLDCPEKSGPRKRSAPENY